MRSPELIQEKVNELKRGEKPDGSVIGYYRNPDYAAFKKTLNPLASGTVDLILTGSFSRQLFVEEKSKNTYIFDSYDDKTDSLIAKYGLDIMGLSPKEWREYQATKLRDGLVRFIKKRIGQ